MKNKSDQSIVNRFVDAINAHDADEIVKLMSEDHIFVDASDNKSVGKKGMKEAWKGYFELFPDYQIEVSEITENETVFGLFGYASGTYKKMADNLNSNFWRIPASWKAIVENNQIKHWQVYCDYSDLLKIVERNKQTI